MPPRRSPFALTLAIVFVLAAFVGFSQDSSAQLEPCWEPCEGTIWITSATGYGSTCDDAVLDANSNAHSQMLATCNGPTCWQACDDETCTWENGQWRADVTWRFICSPCND